MASDTSTCTMRPPKSNSGSVPAAIAALNRVRSPALTTPGAFSADSARGTRFFLRMKSTS